MNTGDSSWTYPSSPESSRSSEYGYRSENITTSDDDLPGQANSFPMKEYVSKAGRPVEYQSLKHLKARASYKHNKNNPDAPRRPRGRPRKAAHVTPKLSNDRRSKQEREIVRNAQQAFKTGDHAKGMEEAIASATSPAGRKAFPALAASVGIKKSFEEIGQRTVKMLRDQSASTRCKTVAVCYEDMTTMDDKSLSGICRHLGLKRVDVVKQVVDQKNSESKSLKVRTPHDPKSLICLCFLSPPLFSLSSPSLLPLSCYKFRTLSCFLLSELNGTNAKILTSLSPTTLRTH